MTVIRGMTRFLTRSNAAMTVANKARDDAATAASEAAASQAEAKRVADTVAAMPMPTVPPTAIEAAVAAYLSAHPPAKGKDGSNGVVGTLNVNNVVVPALALNGTASVVAIFETPFTHTDYKVARQFSAGLTVGTNLQVTGVTKAMDRVTLAVKGLGITLAGTVTVISYG